MRATQPLSRAVRRFKLTTKQGPKDYYKGNRTGRMGRHTKHGGYIVDFRLVRTYVAPDLEKFPLTPFVSKRIPRPTYFAQLDSRSPAEIEEDNHWVAELLRGNEIVGWKLYQTHPEHNEQVALEAARLERLVAEELRDAGADDDVAWKSEVSELGEPVDVLTVPDDQGLRRPNMNWYPLTGQGMLLRWLKKNGMRTMDPQTL